MVSAEKCICDFCGNSFSSFWNMKIHALHSCLQNPKRLNNRKRTSNWGFHKQSINKNTKCINKDKKYVCQYCQQNLSSSAALQRHVRRSSCPAKPNSQGTYQCNMCGLSYNSIHVRNLHIESFCPKQRSPKRQQSTDKLKRIALALTGGSFEVPKKQVAKKSSTSEFFAESDNVFVFDGTWMYYATILSVRSIRNGNLRHLAYRIHYNGWSRDYDTTLEQSRLMKVNEEAKEIKRQIEELNYDFDNSYTRLKENSATETMINFSTYSVGEDVFVYEEGLLCNATIVEVGETDLGHYKVHYKKSRDEWIRVNRIVRKTRTSTNIKNKLKLFQQEGKPINQELGADEIRTTDFYSYFPIDGINSKGKDLNQPHYLDDSSNPQAKLIKYSKPENHNAYLETFSTLEDSGTSLSLDIDQNNNILEEPMVNKEFNHSTPKLQDWKQVPPQDFHSWMKKWFPSWSPTEI